MKPELTVKSAQWHKMSESVRKQLSDLCEVTVDPFWTAEAFVMHDERGADGRSQRSDKDKSL